MPNGQAAVPFLGNNLPSRKVDNVKLKVSYLGKGGIEASSPGRANRQKELRNAEGRGNRSRDDQLGYLGTGGRRAGRHTERGGVTDDALCRRFRQDGRDRGR